MPKLSSASRRRFLQQIGATSLLMAAGPLSSFAAREQAEERMIRYNKSFSPNDTIRLAVIGFGIQGHGDTATALKVPGVELVAVCDLYNGRLDNAKELYGDKIFTTRNYQEILGRKDVDAVIIATSDHWHARITKEALKAGKAVYCEKPMVHKISEGMDVVNASLASKGIIQIGSQRVSSIIYAKAQELLQAGEIGKLNMVNAVYDRQNAIGAWEYTMPLDASPDTVDWNRYVEGMNKIPFDPKKFFWWRNYKEFGTGVAGDLFVHLLSGTHVITGSKGPEKIYASGQLSYWKDGRNVPDVMTGILQYPDTAAHPAFQLTLQVNFVSGTGGGETIRLVGDEGVIDIKYNGLTVKHSIMPKAPGFGGYDAVMTYPKSMQQQLTDAYKQKYTDAERRAPHKDDIDFKAPPGYSDHLDHITRFFDAIRGSKQIVEDATFGFRAAAPALACNDSYFNKKIVFWNPEKMQLENS
ncbi:Gfo/Idh/MocA family protein [Deminuibacter soli]|uniref:Gfo/Idh/MocA family oxidoreductase n=1 Tax=Deminuibacter soli TaxID=2291815 RepID=A0A3E1NFQ4_9BACT|nr:Gfo/Idh/MocA family oxidoreductase [Deminuibacter soli]RFM26805.1 gfo/Idh/MocA family oxidoreductase [Deminuibacter soli]